MKIIDVVEVYVCIHVIYGLIFMWPKNGCKIYENVHDARKDGFL